MDDTVGTSKDTGVYVLQKNSMQIADMHIIHIIALIVEATGFRSLVRETDIGPQS